MKKIIMSALLLGASATAQAQSVPVYLDESKPMEQRIDDALSRMTLDEKIAVIHAQSKFSSPGVKRLGFPDLWTDDPSTHLPGSHMESGSVASVWREFRRRGIVSQQECDAGSWRQHLSHTTGRT